MRHGRVGIATVPARAALAGNPSDGYGGAVLAVPIRELSATVRVCRSETFVIESPAGEATPTDHGVHRLALGDLHHLLQHVGLVLQ